MTCIIEPVFELASNGVMSMEKLATYTICLILSITKNVARIAS